MSALIKFLRAFDNAIAKIENGLLVGSVLLLLGFAVLQLILRNVFNSGIGWADIFNRSLVLWIGFFGATLAAKENRHLSVEALTKFLPKRITQISEILVGVFTAGISWLLAVASWGFVKDVLTYEAQDVLFTGFPKGYFTVIFPIGFGMLTFRYLLKALESLLKANLPLTRSSTDLSSKGEVMEI